METVEGTAEERGAPDARSPSPSTELATNSVIRPLDVRETKQAMDTYQQGLRSLLEDGDWQQTGDGAFVKKSGWRKIATWFGLSVSIVSQRVERDEQGSPLRASVIARAEAPNGRFMEGDGHCAATERRFKGTGAQKIENDLINTATTRAKNRAIADLVGMGAVSAEEVDGTSHRPAGPEFGEPASDELQEKLVRALNVLVQPEHIVNVIEAMAKDAGDYLPRISARAVCIAVAQRMAEAGVPQEDPEPDAEPDEPTTEGVTDGGDSDEAEGDGDHEAGGDAPDAGAGDEGGAESAEGS